jgi:L-cysteine:1D-myo-inositol 2-amino-2-deoxy-alpha-D-glucopyranoside ligase
MQLYNSLSREIEPFTSRGEAVSVYVCGITPYDATHLGHAFTYTVLDVIIRYLEFKGREIDYVQNVTDVDDDILRKAEEVGENWKDLGDRWTARFIQDMIDLNVRPPDRFPRATDVIPQIIDVVQRLVESDLAYESGGSIYFDLDAWPSYGKLSRLSREEMLPIANERGNDPDDANKRHPLDFVLWQAKAPGEPAWDSPWGPGRPGWHIECSTMAVHFLGTPVDVHSGGADLEFPHHESEIAQAEGATDEEPFVRYWVHTAMVCHEGDKMSKSLGNLVMVDDLLDDCTPDALRLYVGSHHYRQEWSHDEEKLERAGRLSQKLTAAAEAHGGIGSPLDGEAYRSAFIEAMDSDLNTPLALTHLERLADAILDSADDGRDVAAAQETLRSLGTVFGLRLDAPSPEPRVVDRWQRHMKDFT